MGVILLRSMKTIKLSCQASAIASLFFLFTTHAQAQDPRIEADFGTAGIVSYYDRVIPHLAPGAAVVFIGSDGTRTKYGLSAKLKQDGSLTYWRTDRGTLLLIPNTAEAAQNELVHVRDQMLQLHMWGVPTVKMVTSGVAGQYFIEIADADYKEFVGGSDGAETFERFVADSVALGGAVGVTPSNIIVETDRATGESRVLFWPTTATTHLILARTLDDGSLFGPSMSTVRRSLGAIHDMSPALAVQEALSSYLNFAQLGLQDEQINRAVSVLHASREKKLRSLTVQQKICSALFGVRY